jgi:hypothetical protein
MYPLLGRYLSPQPCYAAHPAPWLAAKQLDWLDWLPCLSRRLLATWEMALLRCFMSGVMTVLLRPNHDWVPIIHAKVPLVVAWMYWYRCQSPYALQFIPYLTLPHLRYALPYERARTGTSLQVWHQGSCKKRRHGRPNGG